MTDFLIRPSVNNKSLFKYKNSIDENGKKIIIPIIEEKPLTLYLNNQEIVTMMTIGDYPEYLALGYLYNQGMLNDFNKVRKIEYHKDLKTIVVRTADKTNYEKKLKKKVNTSLVNVSDLNNIRLIRTSWKIFILLGFVFLVVVLVVLEVAKT